MEVLITEKSSAAEGIARLVLTPIDGQALPAFTAGAHIDLHLENGMTRQYSLCNPPNQTHQYVIGVLHDPASRGGSRFVHENLQIGQRLHISKPRNLFPIAAAAKHHLLLAGGIGITPILCMAEHLAAEQSDFELHYCSRERGRTAFLDHIQQSVFADRSRLYWDVEGAPLDIDAVLQQPQTDTHLYVCGPAGFIDHVLKAADRLSWSTANVHREFFSSAAVDNVAAADGFQVEIEGTGQVIAVAADQTVVEALACHGIDIPVSCEQGVCGTCLTRVVAGEPEHRDMFLTDEEHARNDQFTPCCSRAKSTRLVLAL